MIYAHVACEMAQHFGGERIYIPRNKSHNKHSRDLEMYRQFNGHNYRALAKKYGMAREHVYRVISDIRAQKKQEIKNLRSKALKTPKDTNSEPH
ncbi:MAG: hypothetical protein ORN98_09240 [Alphaproteobacteria bacterium]|nr:hypothetical protein [Alphaproteobacteria bacterium]